jgi:hypothetical protein
MNVGVLAAREGTTRQRTAGCIRERAHVDAHRPEIGLEYLLLQEHPSIKEPTKVSPADFLHSGAEVLGLY